MSIPECRRFFPVRRRSNLSCKCDACSAVTHAFEMRDAGSSHARDPGHGRRSDALQPLLSEIVASKVDILIPVGPPQTRAAHAATTSIPILTFDLEIDPVEAGLVSSLAHPGGNVTVCSSIFPSSARLGSGC